MGSRGRLTGEVVVITGAARGLGALMAQRAADRGARVALLGLEPARLAEVAHACGPEARWWRADVTDEAAMAEVAREVVRHFGRIDIVVANAGIATGGPVAYSDPRTYARVIEVNLLGSVATARAFLPTLIEAKGYFLQITSLAALATAPMMSAYCAAASGVEAFAHCLRAEVVHSGMRVGIGYLSWTDTDMVRGTDRNDALWHLRRNLIFPATRTYPLEPTVERLLDGVSRRDPRVYVQRWLPWVQFVRGFVPSIMTWHARRTMAGLEARWLVGGGESDLIGPGGAADERERRPESDEA